jgi:oxygen-dependent protoporphyrinogen oxidase
MTSVVVVGGGLAGLTAAFRLRQRVDVTLLELAPRLGGQIHTELSDGYVVERGAEGFVARSQALPALARDLGMLADELIGQSVMRSYGFDGQRLLALEPGEAASFLGFQVPPDDLGKGIRSFRHGMGSLIAALEAQLREASSLRTGVRVRALEAGSSGVRVVLDDGSALAADAAIVATSAAAAADVLAPVAGAAADELRAAPTLSSVTVELAFERAAIAHALDGTGFVVAPDQQSEGLRACTFTSSKFVGRAPEGSVSLRAFFRPSPEQLASDSDEEYVARALRCLRRVLPVHGEPLRVWISRWANALPVFSDAQRARVAALETALAPYPIQLAGSAFHGSGIDVAVSSGERAAARCGAPREASGCA